jgi:Uncharacterised nucleotidyltransferase
MLQSSSIGDARASLEIPSRAAALRAVDAMIDRAPTLEDLEHQGLHLLAARRWHELGRPVPDRLLAQQRLAVAISIAAPIVLERVRAGYDGPILLLKGPEVAIAYPDPTLRSYCDLDLLVNDAPAAQRALIRAGFEAVGAEGRYRDKHHLRPLRLRSLPLTVEVHHAPSWPRLLKPPSAAELLEASVPARFGVDGILGLPPGLHAILLAAHAWAHAPLGHLRQLLDVALVAADAGHQDWAELAAPWGAGRLWGSTAAALEALFGDARRPASLRLWARHLASVRERTVFEAHMTAWMSPLWCLSGAPAVRAGATAFAADLRPSPGERWRHKLVRTRVALAHCRRSAIWHDAVVHKRAHAAEGGEAARAA